MAGGIGTQRIDRKFLRGAVEAQRATREAGSPRKRKVAPPAPEVRALDDPAWPLESLAVLLRGWGG